MPSKTNKKNMSAERTPERGIKFTITDEHLEQLKHECSIIGFTFEFEPSAQPAVRCSEHLGKPGVIGFTDSEYIETMEDLLSGKPSYSIIKTGQRMRLVRKKNGLIYQKADGILVVPASYMYYELVGMSEPTSLGPLARAWNRFNLTNEERDSTGAENMARLILQNHTGHHYRNHTAHVTVPSCRTAV